MNDVPIVIINRKYNGVKTRFDEPLFDNFDRKIFDTIILLAEMDLTSNFIPTAFPLLNNKFLKNSKLLEAFPKAYQQIIRESSSVSTNHHKVEATFSCKKYI
jgi:hypothetical protein